MSDFKHWKNKERGLNLAERFGFKFDIAALKEDQKGFGEGQPADDKWSKKQEIEEELAEEEVESDTEVQEEGGRANRKENEKEGESRRMKTSSAMREEEEPAEDVEPLEEDDEVEEGRKPRMQRQRQDLNSPTQSLRTTRPSPEEHGEEEEEEDKKKVAAEHKTPIDEQALKELVRKHIKIALEEIKNES